MTPTSSAGGATAADQLRASLTAKGLSPDRAALAAAELTAAAHELTPADPAMSGLSGLDAVHAAMTARIDADQAAGLLSADEAAAAHAAVGELEKNAAPPPAPGARRGGKQDSTLDQLLGLLEDTNASRSERVNVGRFLKRMVDDGLIDISA